jgi:hypothetical protein
MMRIARLNRSVVKVVQLERDATGNMNPVVLYEKDQRKKKKMSGPLRPLEKAVRRVSTAQEAFAQSYLSRHDRSNRKNRDGWIRDVVPNVVNAGKKGNKKLRVNRLVFN